MMTCGPPKRRPTVPEEGYLGAATRGDRIELMRLFVQIAETRSLVAAGRILGRSQPSTSRQLKQLETVLGVQLVQRSSSEFVLTEAGEQFLAAATGLLADWDAAAEAARLTRDELRGQIRVAAPVSSGQTILASSAAKFLAEHPAVTMDWRLVDEPGDLAAGGYDIWIRGGPIRDESLIVRPLWRAERSIVARADHPSVGHPADLEQYNAVQLVTYVSREVHLVNDDRSTTTLRLRPVFITDNIFAALTAVKEGIGYAVLPHWVMRDELQSGAIVDLCPTWHPPEVILSVAYPQVRFRPARVKAFLEFLRTELEPGGDRLLPSFGSV